jgi:hypothetical protein
MPSTDSSVTLTDLNDAEQRVIKMMETTAAVIEIILMKLSGSDSNGYADSSQSIVVDEKTKGFIESVFKLQELFRSLLTGPDEKYSYRPFERNVYGCLADFDCAADSINIVSDRVADLRATLESFVGKVPTRQNKQPDQTPDVIMLDA